MDQETESGSGASPREPLATLRLTHWWSFPAVLAEPTPDHLLLREQFDSLLLSQGLDLLIHRRSTDRVGRVLSHVIYEGLAANGISRDALVLTDLHALVIEMVPVCHALLDDLGLHAVDCASLRLALCEGPSGSRQSMIVSEIVDHYSIRWLWPDALDIESLQENDQTPVSRRLCRSQLLLEHLIRQYLYQPSLATLQAIGYRIKDILLRGRIRAHDAPCGLHWFDLGYVPEAIRYKSEQLLKQQRRHRMVTDIMHSRLVPDA